MMDPNFTGIPTNFMPETLHHGSHHRRAQSESFFRFPFADDDDILLDDVVADFNFASIDLPSLSGDTPVPTTTGDSGSSDINVDQTPARKPSHIRSLSVGSEFFDEFGLTSAGEPDTVSGGGGGGYRKNRHRHSNSMDGFVGDFLGVDNSKKALDPDKLAQLSLIDPKRAKRIIANRQSAARSKERKTRYTGELEQKVQTLQNEATTLSAEVTKLQRDTSGLTSENKELKLRLEALEQHAHLRDALNEALREEVNRLKLEASQLPHHLNRMNYNASLPPQFSSHNQPLHHFANTNAQQPQSQKTQMPNSNTTIDRLKPSFMDFN
ncbi:transcription factor VIP1-like [Rutidosis leptorrhynchoides]|uniref:transcription factor VIP1-like n=1 Tax=Rutidosis leptorrhynchoides TaxID=125765 RepID=UPI003A990BB6